MKKIVALICVMLMVVACFAGCGANKDEAKSDSEYVISNNKLVVGITDFEPMDYQDKDTNEWIGFDADMAREFGKFIGVETVEFVEIEWDYKTTELENKNIDCVWNGMTLNDEVLAAMECSKAYCNNAQVVVVKKDVADKYKTVEACKDLKFAVENGSAGMEQAEANGFEFIPVLAQADALMEVASGTADAAIIDSLMAGAMVGEGTGYDNLAYTVSLNSEKYGVGFRKGSDLAAKLNEFLAQAYAENKTMKVAERYGVQAAIVDPAAE